MQSRNLVFLLGLAALITFLAMRFPYALDSENSKANLFQMSIWAIFISGGALAARRLPLGHVLKYSLIWLVVILTLIVGYSYKGEVLRSRLVAELFPNQLQANANGTLSVRAREDGHFYIEALINGLPVNFLIDTGASELVLSQQDAQRVGVDLRRLSYTRQYSTANGMVGGAPIRIARLQVGPLRLDDFQASVNGGQLDNSLMGMAALRRLGGVRIDGDIMTIGQER